MTRSLAGPSLRDRLRAFTTARVSLGRVGSALPTSAVLDFQLAHARARDAVHASLDEEAVRDALGGLAVVSAASQANERQTYLLRPDLGRRLRPGDRERLGGLRSQLAIVLADGLSASAVQVHGPALAKALIARAAGWRIGPIVIARQARVALGDEIGQALGADLVVVLIGERPGLSAADSLGAYVTWKPALGRLDSERNCVSNIRPPHGLGIDAAADEIMRIAGGARLRGCTGVALSLDSPSLQLD